MVDKSAINKFEICPIQPAKETGSVSEIKKPSDEKSEGFFMFRSVRPNLPVMS